MSNILFFILIGYLSGSVLFEQLISRLLDKKDILSLSKDNNPGAANAFLYGGFWCGLLTLCGDLFKGFFPVHLFVKDGGDFDVFPLFAAMVLAAPVLGHAFPVFFRFHGGKGIAVTFGCLLGLLPMEEPVVSLALLFVFFSVVLKVMPHFHRTIVTYLAALAGLFCLKCEPGVILGFMMITAIVCIRMHMSKEERTEMRIRPLWMH